MKTSNIIILSAFVVAIIGLFVNAFQFKKIYLDTDWNDPYHNCVKLDIPHVQAVYFITKDNPKMWSADDIEITKGEKYIFATPDTSQFELIPTDSGLVVHTKVRHPKVFVILPELNRLEAGNRESIKVKGFTCDSLLLRSNSNSAITLENCNIHQLSVQNTGGRVAVEEENTVGYANIVLYNGTFTSDDIPYEAATCQADAESSVNLTGRSIRMFR